MVVSYLIEFLKRNIFLSEKVLEFLNRFCKRLTIVITQEFAIEI
jgi:hypothetical protein